VTRWKRFGRNAAASFGIQMTAERHLILQEITLRPSGEWTPQGHGWVVARVAEGAGYWRHGGAARELNAGDGFVAGGNGVVVRSSQLGILKLQFFTVQPQYLNGLLTVSEWRQLEFTPNNSAPQVVFFGANEPLGQKFTRLAAQPHTDNLSIRCSLLQLWTGAVASLMSHPAPGAGGNKLRERFVQLVSQLSEAELCQRSLPELAAQLHCSERHFSRLFREEFGVPLRARQIELRLQRASQLLADPDAKIINVAYDSGYRHLGLFNAMFKKRFGMTPSEWRQQNFGKNNPSPPRGNSSRLAVIVGILFALLGCFFSPAVSAEDNADSPAQAAARAALIKKMQEPAEPPGKMKIHVVDVSTNGPHFTVEKYLVSGNSILKPTDIGGILTNVPAAFGTNVTFDAIRAALGDLQMAYRERGFVTVAVALPPQKLTNATVKVKVTEGRLAAINVTGNRWFSSNNVMSSLPSLHTNMLLNSHVFQRELDQANASRDRQIYPVIGPGLEPGTSELTLKVKDRFPGHARVEVNNTHTPGTPDLRVNFNAQYDNLWDLEHQIGLQYSSAFEQWKSEEQYNATPFDDPLVANYSAYYRMPLGRRVSTQESIDANPGKFGYNEVTHQFNLPPSSDRPELNFFASRSTTDTGVQKGPNGILAQSGMETTPGGITFTPVTITTNSAGENVTLNEDVGLKFSLPLPQIGNVSSTFSFGADFKHYENISYNTNENFFILQQPDSSAPGGLVTTVSPQPQSQTPVYSSVDYFPLNVGLNGSMPDSLGTTFFNAQANFNLAAINGVSQVGTNITRGGLSVVAGNPNVHDHYITLQLGVDRVQNIYKDWSVKLHADGQWANGALFSNEQFAMGGTAGVRGYLDGEAYGDTGWRMSIEPQTPLINIGMVDGDIPFWVRSSVFVDYGEIYLLDKSSATTSDRAQFCGVGWNLTANIGNHLDARLTIAFPLIATTMTQAGDVHVYFGVGAQF
jgi:hemolysin activation/secretion protein/AraC-like DNA-binding protein